MYNFCMLHLLVDVPERIKNTGIPAYNTLCIVRIF
jgi:hypothetical protein